MKYSDIHTLVFQRIREQRSWPNAASSTKLAEQLQFIYAATIKVARDTKETVLDGLYKSTSLVLTPKPTGATEDSISYYETSFPEDIFRQRTDNGILYMVLDGDVIISSADVLDVSTFFRLVRKKNQYGNRLVATDFSLKNLLVHGSTTLDLNYMAIPVKPVATGTGDNLYSTLEFPLPSPFEEEVVGLVMMHVEAVLTGNTSKSQISGLISQLYSGDMVEEVTE